jgi:uncharacterized protein YdeI (BOF family)
LRAPFLHDALERIITLRNLLRGHRRGSEMIAKDLVKYGAVFAAGVFAVLGVIGFNSLVQAQPAVPEASLEQATPVAPDTNFVEEQGEEATALTPDSSQSQQPKPQTKDPSAESKSAASELLGAGTVIEGVTRVGDLVRNTMVTVEGTVVRINDEDEFVISDETGSVQIYTGRTFFTVDQGQRVTVRGLVDEDALLEIYADEIVLPDGSVVKVRHWR